MKRVAVVFASVILMAMNTEAEFDPPHFDKITKMNTGINAINEAVKEAGAFTHPLFNELGKVIVGQNYLTERLVIGLLANGHVLLEGVPGLAKTLSVRTLATAVQARFNRIQFTPDLLPADIVGTLIYNPQDSKYHATRGPIFANFVLADEINRAPAKVQSALLEAMQERQVTLGEQTFRLENCPIPRAGHTES